MKPFLILIIEDDLQTSKIYKEFLTEDKDKLTGNVGQPVEIVCVSNWSDTELELERSSRVFDLILFDLRFPNLPEEVGVRGKDRDQHEHLPEVRRRQPSATVAVATSYAHERHLEICVDVLAKGWSDEFIPKDLPWPGILERILRARDIRRQREMAARPIPSNVLRTVAEDIAAHVGEFESRIRLLVHGTALEDRLKSELQGLRAKIKDTSSYLLRQSDSSPEEVPITSLVDQIRGSYEGQTGQMLKCVGECGGSVRTYREDLEVALDSIIQNAIDAVKYGGSEIAEDAVRIEVDDDRAPHHMVHIRVIDKGMGFTKAALDTLFTPGQSGWMPNERSLDERRHRGLGLYIARRRLYSIGGDLEVSRFAEKGETVVTLAVPEWTSK